MDKVLEKRLKANIKKVFGNISVKSLNKMSDKELLENKFIGKKTFEYIRTRKEGEGGMNIEEFVKQRDEALINLDLDWIIKNTNCKGKEIALVSAHKARYETTSLPDEDRHASRKWLQERGYKRQMMTDFLPDNQLPE